MAFFKTTLTAGNKDFAVRSKSAATGQKLALSGTIFAEAGATLELQGDLGDGTYVTLATIDVQDAAATVLPRFNAEKYRISGTGTFILNADVLLSVD